MKSIVPLFAALAMAASLAVAAEPAPAPAHAEPAASLPRVIRTPKPGPNPRLNSAPVFGVRPGHPFLYQIPATGARPMEFTAEDLPEGLKLNEHTGQITGSIAKPGEYVVTLHAENEKGADAKRFKIVVGEEIALTPAMGWNSWNHYGSRVSAEIVLKNAKAMKESGLIDHGYTYVNIDDAWQGVRGGPFNAIQGNDKFPDMQGLCEAVHAMGLKIGIYSTPWVQSYAGYIGGSAENPEGTWVKNREKKQPNQKVLPWHVGKYSFAKNDAQQWAAWGIDYLKYDWNPIEPPEVKEMYDALRTSGRDVVYSLSNNARPSLLINHIDEIRKYANSWRITGDIKATWDSMIQHALPADKWRQYASPGHRNDPDMLEIGNKKEKEPGLAPEEDYTHMTWWCMLSAPLLLGNDLSTMDEFTLNVLTNDEVIAVNQDELCEQAARVSGDKDLLVYAKKLADGSTAVAFFNLGKEPAKISAKWSDLKLDGKRNVRDLWRQKDLGRFADEFSVTVASHSAELVKISE